MNNKEKIQRPVLDFFITKQEWGGGLLFDNGQNTIVKHFMENVDEFLIGPDPVNGKLAIISFGRGHITIPKARIERAIYEYHLANSDLDSFIEMKEKNILFGREEF